MIAIDTNVLARIFIDDENIEQVKLARNLAKKYKQVFISQVVQAELVWVLKKAFGLDKTQMCSILNELSQNDAFALQRDEIFYIALQLYENNSIDFADCLIAAEAKQIEHCSLYTFDQKLARLKNVILLG